MKRADEARYRELTARARVLLASFDEQRIHEVQALLEKLLGADRLDPHALAELERLIDGP
jgi:hypothetical protein